jgi:hypothetical protein
MSPIDTLKRSCRRVARGCEDVGGRLGSTGDHATPVPTVDALNGGGSTFPTGLLLHVPIIRISLALCDNVTVHDE